MGSPKGLIEDDIHGLCGAVEVGDQLEARGEVGKEGEENLLGHSLSGQLPQPHRGQ